MNIYFYVPDEVLKVGFCSKEMVEMICSTASTQTVLLTKESSPDVAQY